MTPTDKIRLSGTGVSQVLPSSAKGLSLLQSVLKGEPLDQVVIWARSNQRLDLGGMDHDQLRLLFSTWMETRRGSSRVNPQVRPASAAHHLVSQQTVYPKSKTSASQVT